MDSISEDGGRSLSDGPDQESSLGEEGREEGLIEAFLSTYDRRRTREAYGHDLRDFFGKKEVMEAEARAPTETEVEGYLWEVAGGKGSSAARRRGMALRAFYGWAKTEELVPGDKAERLRGVVLSWKEAWEEERAESEGPERESR